MNTIWIVLPILTLLMFDLGLSLRLEDFGDVFRRPWPVVVALFGQLILLPAIALGLACTISRRRPPKRRTRCSPSWHFRCCWC